MAKEGDSDKELNTAKSRENGKGWRERQSQNWIQQSPERMAKEGETDKKGEDCDGKRKW